MFWLDLLFSDKYFDSVCVFLLLERFLFNFYSIDIVDNFDSL